MKKSHLLLLLCLVTASVSTGCKRGEDDPAISLTSRDGRLMREWKLVGWDRVVTENDNGVETVSTRSYDGTVLTTTNGNGNTSTRTYSLDLVFDKNGYFEATEVEDGDLLNDIGYWQWLNSDKNKVVLLLTNNVFGGSLRVRRLSTKDLVLENNYTEVDDPAGTDIITTVTTEKLTFESI
jgi:hypothetical protein